MHDTKFWWAGAVIGVVLLAAGAIIAGTPREAQPRAGVSQPEVAQPAGGEAASPSAQIANPASVNCEKVGGRLEIVDTPQGQSGICHLPSGKACEEWALFRGECGEVKGSAGASTGEALFPQ